MSSLLSVIHTGSGDWIIIFLSDVCFSLTSTSCTTLQSSLAKKTWWNNPKAIGSKETTLYYRIRCPRVIWARHSGLPQSRCHNHNLSNCIANNRLISLFTLLRRKFAYFFSLALCYRPLITDWNARRRRRKYVNCRCDLAEERWWRIVHDSSK
jgi:hypothetical protein